MPAPQILGREQSSVAENTVCVEGEKSFFLASQAELLPDDREMAWAERTIKPNPALKYVLGKYCEADRANLNKQFWALDQLRLAQPSITYSPMNMLHSQRIVGAFIDSEMMYPLDETAAAEVPQHPYIEALGAFWRYYFPSEYAMISQAHQLGSLFLSMECIADSITCAGEGGCGETYDYAGPKSMTYCAHLNQGESIKQLNGPHFLAGALIVPPERPGWADASVRDISGLVQEHRLEAEMAYEGFKAGSPHLSAAQWEYLMNKLLEQAHPLEAAEHKAGTRMVLTESVGHFPPGTRGMVHSAHNGPYYGVTMGEGPVYYCPAPAMEPNDTPPEQVGPGIYAKYEPSRSIQMYLDGLREAARKFAAERGNP